MRRLTLENCKEEIWDDLISIIPNREIENNEYFITSTEVMVVLSNGDKIVIPGGFRFDGSSVPKFLRSIFSTYGPFLLSAMIHDWLYKTDYKRELWGLKKAQLFSDDEMLIWSEVMNYASKRQRLNNKLRHRAVRLFGKGVYKKRSDVKTNI